jgi:hypothetical protein
VLGAVQYRVQATPYDFAASLAIATGTPHFSPLAKTDEAPCRTSAFWTMAAEFGSDRAPGGIGVFQKLDGE